MLNKHKEAPAPRGARASNEYRGTLSNVRESHRQNSNQFKTKILGDFNSSPVVEGQRWSDAREWAVKLYCGTDLNSDEIEELLIEHYGHVMANEMRGLVKDLPKKFDKRDDRVMRPTRISPICPKTKPKPIDLGNLFPDSVSVPESAFLEKSDFELNCGREDARLLLSCCFREGDLIAIKTSHKSPSFVKSREEWLEYLIENPVPQSKEGSWVYANPVRPEVLDLPPKDRHIRASDIIKHRFIVLENDNVSLQTQLSFAGYVLPYLQAIVFSARKSYHCWLRVDAETPEDYRKAASNIKSLVGAGCSRFGDSGYDVCTICSTAHPRMCGAARGLEEQRLIFLSSSPSQEPVFRKEVA
jgi:hypothetical protein